MESNDKDDLSNDQNGKQTHGFRENLYSRIKIPLKTMDIIIGILVICLVILLAAGILLPS